MSKITPRILAIATVGSVATIAALSTAMAAFFTTPQSNMSCSSYQYHAGYGYGYDCKSSAGSAASSSSSTGGSTTTPSNTTGVVTTNTGSTTSTGTTNVAGLPVRPTVTIFNNFTKKCETAIKDLTDSRLTAFYNEINVINQSNVHRALTRAEFLKLVLNAAKADVTGETTSPFADTPTSHSLYQYVAYAHKIGMVSGQNGNFRPNDTITRAEAAKIFVNAANINLSTEIKTFADVSTSNSLATYIQTAYDNCILHGRKTQGGESTVANRVYEPTSNITLAETAKVLYNIVK